MGSPFLCVDYPAEMVAARKASPLLLGVGDGEYIIAFRCLRADQPHPNVVYLKDGEIVTLRPLSFSITTARSGGRVAVVDKITWSIADAEKGDYAHFMEKEISSSRSRSKIRCGAVFPRTGSTAQFGGLNITAAELRQIDRFLFCACGTAWHACS